MPPFRPRIYLARVPSAHPATDFADLDLPERTLGFDHLMVDCHEEQVASALATANDQGVGLLLELSLDRPAPATWVVKGKPEWQTGGDDDLPDPRSPGSLRPMAGLRLDNPQLAAEITRWWSARLTQLAEAGLAGFCIHLDGPAPPGFFRDVIAAVKMVRPGCRFVAWTPGIDAARVLALTGCGFDAAISSSAWWDFRAGWLADEARRLKGFGTLIALASPDRQAMPAEPADAAPAYLRELRTLWLGALTADGLLVEREFARKLATLAPQAWSADVRQALALCKDKPPQAAHPWALLSAPGSKVAVLHGSSSAEGDEQARVMLINTQEHALEVDAAAVTARFDGLVLTKGLWPAGDAPPAGEPLLLQPFETRIFSARPARDIVVPLKDSKRALEAAARSPRIAIENISPCVEGGRFVVKRTVGQVLTVEADIFGEGHDQIAACLRWRAADEEEWSEAPMSAISNDRWHGEFLLARTGRYQYQVEAWLDVFGAWRDEIQKKTAAGQQVGLELQEGVLLLQASLAQAEKEDRLQLVAGLKRVIKACQGQRNEADKLALMLAPDVLQLVYQTRQRAFSSRSLPVLQVDAERRAAGFASWYELFPRSMGPDASQHGSFLDVLPRLPALQAMGFDILYFPPIHPIGVKHRKGPNNTLDASGDDPGSPYAIGSPEGGHDAIHPALGTLDDFRTLQRAAKAHGLELALDFAIQCSPDHPWLKEHPDWFTWRPDGTIRYAENPPKKYQDIVNVDFYAEGAVPRLWLALRDVVMFWVREGVKVFRVDNPHTKPMPFWEWLIADVRGRSPDVIFLAEAFTRPKPMYRLAKLGFSQSYTYFTWRHGKQEFIDYLTELADGPPRDFFRPHFFVNTPDINPYFLQRSGRAGFVIRAALAATLSGLWGVYSGFELCEADPVPGKEEYLNSEKYQLRQRDWSQPGNIVREITLLNSARRSNPALQTHLGVRFCPSSGDNVLCFTKTVPGNIVFVAICLDPHAAHDFTVELPLQDWKLGEDDAVEGEDLVHGNTFTLHGRHHQLRLDPAELAFKIWRLRPGGVA